MYETFLLYSPLALLGLLVIIGGAFLLSRFGNVFRSFKDFVVRCFGATVFYAVSIGVAYIIGMVLEYIVHPLILGALPTGIVDRIMLSPALYFLLGLGSLHIIMPTSWATSNWGGYISWIITGGMIVFVGGYALGIFPPVSMWTSTSFLGMPPEAQEFVKWLWPPVYPGVTGFADGC